MTQYLLSVYEVEGQPERTPEETQKAFKDVDVFNHEVMDEGAWVFAGGLYPPDTATTIRLQGDDVMIVDGPFAETKEQVGGFWVIEAADLDAAIAYAKRGAIACRNAVEVRPFQDNPED